MLSFENYFCFFLFFRLCFSLRLIVEYILFPLLFNHNKAFSLEVNYIRTFHLLTLNTKKEFP